MAFSLFDFDAHRSRTQTVWADKASPAEPSGHAPSANRNCDPTAISVAARLSEALEHIQSEIDVPALPNECLVHPKTHMSHVALYGGFPAELDSPDTLPDAMRVPKDTALLGVIDTNVALSRHWTRTAEGKTRILCAWQQAADRTGFDHLVSSEIDAAYGKAQQHFLPFGREFLADALDALIAQATPKGQTQNREACEKQLHQAMGCDGHFFFGDGRVSQRYSPAGTHHLAQRAGAAPTAEKAKNTRILVTNLPPAMVLGPGSKHRNGFAILALVRMIALSDRLWDCNGYKADDGMRGFPLHISLGTQGDTDDSSVFGLMSRINQDRAKRGFRPVMLRPVCKARQIRSDAAQRSRGINAVTVRRVWAPTAHNVNTCVPHGGTESRFLSRGISNDPDTLK